MKSESFVSVVLVVEQPLAAYENALHQIQGELDTHYTDYEIVVVGQGPARGGETARQEDGVLQRVQCVRYIQLAGRTQLDVAWAATLENAIGDFVVMFDPACDPVSAISATVDICKSGFDVVVGVASQGRTLAYRLFRPIADWVLRAADYMLPRNATGLRCLSRRAVNSVTRTGRFHHQLYMRIQKTGYPQTDFRYTLLPGARVPRSLLAGARDVIRLLVFNSSRPLRWMSGIGMIGSLSAFAFGLYSLLIHLVRGDIVQGWTTTILFMSVLFMMQFIMMAFFGEYLGRLLDDRSEQADYSVVFEKNSAVMVNADRVNVLEDSVSSEVNRVQTGRDG